VSDEPPDAFIPLRAVKPGAPADPAAALAEIRQIYFRTSKKTIENDFAHAIELLRGLPDEEMRARAHVYMEGLAEMRREWSPKRGRQAEVKGRTKR
jgi:hypothetical protein